jgi:hypothetical protein
VFSVPSYLSVLQKTLLGKETLTVCLAVSGSEKAMRPALWHSSLYRKKYFSFKILTSFAITRTLERNGEHW